MVHLFSLSLLVDAFVGVLTAEGYVSPVSVPTVQRGENTLQDHPVVLESSQSLPNLCLTKGCVNAAHHVLNAMDPTVDPCDDFYGFACGSFVDRTVIPDEKSFESQFSLISDELMLDMRKLIDAPIDQEDSPTTVKLKKYFSSCTNRNGIENKGLEPMKNILNRMGGWPVLVGEEWEPDSFSWAETMYKNRELGLLINYMFDFYVMDDIKSHKHRLIDINDARLGFKREYLVRGFNDSNVQSYYHFMVDMAVLLGADQEKAETELKDALQFEIQLANISLPAEQRRNMSQLYNRRTLDELSLEAPNIPWISYANQLLQPCGLTVFGNESVNVEHVNYFKKLSHLLEVTPRRVLADYLLWRAVESSVGSLNQAARDARLRFHSQVYGATEHPPRWKECLHGTIGSMDIGAGALYVQNHFDEDSKRAVLELVADLHRQFNDMLRDISWMDDATKRKALKKSEAIDYYIAYADELLNDTLVADYYSALYISDSDYFQNNLNVRLFETNKSFKVLRELVNKKDWRRNRAIAVANAFYNFVDNIVIFPAGVLRGVFYSNDRPRYLNYGAIGFIIGHEITHGFDDRGRQYGAGGSLEDWWSPDTLAKFVEGAQCIIHQYGNITVDSVDMNVNGIITQGENIADNGGMRIARRAYQLYQQRAGREPALPGLQHYSNEQMFWLGVSQAWCSAYREEKLQTKLLTDSHAPPTVRINTSLRNTRQFAEDWQCPVGSRMNPTSRCSIW